MDVTRSTTCSTAVQPKSSSSLLPFLKEFTNLRLFKNAYILVDGVLPTDFYRFEMRARTVESYRVVKGTGDDHTVSASVFLQILPALNGKPFFPNLTAIHVNDLENFFEHHYLILSSKIENVSAFLSDPWDDVQGGIGAFIQALISFTPQIKFLSIIYVQRPLIVSKIFGINYLTSLRTLVISRLAGVQSIASIFSLLKDLTELEELNLTIEAPVKKWCSAQNACPSSTRDRSIPANSSSHLSLKSLQRLTVQGPSQIIYEFLDSLGSPNLVSLSLVSTSWFHVEQLPELRNQPLDASEGQTQASKQLSNQQPAEIPVRACTDACTAPHHHQWSVSRWSKTLENLTVVSRDQTIFDLSGISKLEALKSLVISGSTTPLSALLLSGIPKSLETLDLSFPDPSLTLFELGEIIMRAPNLLTLSSCISISSEQELDSLAKNDTLQHGLEELNMRGTTVQNVGNYATAFPSKVALRLHSLFPNLRRLNYPPKSERENDFWEEVWRLVQVFQQVAQRTRQQLMSGGVLHG